MPLTSACTWACGFAYGETAVVSLVNRYYDPARGRFTTPDPAASGEVSRPSSWNRYAYTEGDPVNYNDPEGLFVWNPNYGQPTNPWGGSFFWSFMLPGVIHQPMLPLDPPTRPECDRKSPANAKKLDWIDAHGDDAAAAAAKIGSTEAIILGLSALESGWGTGPFVVGGRNNYFSQHAPAPGSNGSVTENGNVMATYASYLASALGFDQSKSGQLIQNTPDPAKVAAALQDAGLYGINRDGSKVANFVQDVVSTINGLAKRLDCPPQ